MEEIKGSSLVGQATTVAAAVITITTMANITTAITMANITTAITMGNITTATTTDNITTDNTTTDNTTTDITTTATTTTVSAVDSQMEEDASATTDSPLETSMGTHMELVKGRTTLVERGATQLGGETLVVEICKLLKGFPATHGLIGPVDITDNLLGSGNQ